MQTSSPAPASVTDTLRDATRTHHDAAESHAFQRALFKGRLPREAYVGYLSQMLLVHAPLERHLRAAREADPRIAAIVRDEQLQEPYLREDLAHFGVDPDAVTPLPATADAAAMLESNAADAIALLGFHYVVEGSNNGSRYIARNVARAYDLKPEDGSGLRYLLPYGEDQPTVWAEFKRTVNAAGFTPGETDTMVRAAGDMFDVIARISDDLATLHPLAEEPA